MRIIRSLVGGGRNPEVLAAFRDSRCKSWVETIKAALVGNAREEHFFALTHSLELYDFCKAQIDACDRRLEAAVASLPVSPATGAQRLLDSLTALGPAEKVDEERYAA